MGLQLQEQSTRNQIQMEISDKSRNQQLHFYFVKFWPSPAEIKRDEAVKVLQLMNVSVTCIYHEIRIQKVNIYFNICMYVCMYVCMPS